MSDEYKYDVAFSFLVQDEPLATQLNHLLQDRFKTFLYSEKQREIAGTDGEKLFHSVFGKESRLVVVFYRLGWGQSPWTRIEETAIRKRAYTHGYGFVSFIPLDDNPSVPEWLPPTQLWLDFKRWGIKGAASVIEYRIREFGGEPHEETPSERAARLGRELTLQENRRRFLDSERGVAAANREIATLRSTLELHIAEANRVPSISLSLRTLPDLIVIVGFRNGLAIHWGYQHSNTLDGSKLEVTLWNGFPPFPYPSPIRPARKLKTTRFDFDLSPNQQPCWVMEEHGNQRTYETRDLASFLVKF